MECGLGNKVNFSNVVIYSLSILTSCQFTNEPNREISRGVFQNRGVSGQAFPLLPSPSPFHFFCSRFNFRAITRLETLATQAIDHLILAHDRSNLYVFFFFEGVNLWILHFLAAIIVSSHLSDSLYHWLLLTSFEILLGKNWQVDLHCSLHKFKKAVVSHISESKCDRQTNAWRWIMFMVLIMKAQDILRKKFRAKFWTQLAINDLSCWIK